MSEARPAGANYSSDQEVGWCPGCGDLAILAQLKKALANMAIPMEQQVFLSGTGCAARMPQYIGAYGLQGLHATAPAAATGLKWLRPDLTVWVVLGDGEGMGPGAHHLLQACRRNTDVKVLLINNETRGLSRGQESATTRKGTQTTTSPLGVSDPIWKPAALALAAGATFVARTLDVEVDHLSQMLSRAAAHKGLAFVEILQNCKVFNDLVFDSLTGQASRPDNLLYLEQGKPLVFGRHGRKALGWKGNQLMLTKAQNSEEGIAPAIHDEACENALTAQALALLENPEFPECLGVFRAWSRPTHGENHPDTPATLPALQELLAGPDSWTID
ncbi:MAG: 2-oxoacid:ferredoxin oxidoreductase subunit beta [Gemmataceae bacterium]|nr:2-oxoacid:ferredoxin oxidoreductase subunit beta [Gemmataceae bacterium]